MLKQERCASEDELMISAVQYRIGMETPPNIGRITSSMNTSDYGKRHSIDKVRLFIYYAKIKEAWSDLLNHQILEIDAELS